MEPRLPCPLRIVEDLGGAFGMGAIGGSVWHGFKGIKNSPKGMRLAGSLAEIKLRAPKLGGNFAAWGGLFASCDCTLIAIRGTEDSWNAITAGGVTGALLSFRGGPGAMVRHGIFGCVILGLIEGLQHVITRFADEAGNKPVLPSSAQSSRLATYASPPSAGLADLGQPSNPEDYAPEAPMITDEFVPEEKPDWDKI